jgi:7-cyano-7-deazaguanine synthase
MSKLAVVIVSGGLDSVSLAYHLRAQGYALHLLTFDYGQKHIREIASARQAASMLGGSTVHRLIEIPTIGKYLPSALTDHGVFVPHGHYEEQSMRDTVVPNRNMIMLSIAWGIAVSLSADMLALAVHAGDHFIYPDCRPEFIHAADKALRLATEGLGNPKLHIAAPYLYMTKRDIVLDGYTNGVPFALTWTCYEGRDTHCGVCGACQERREAFKDANIEDPTTYTDLRMFEKGQGE